MSTALKLLSLNDLIDLRERLRREARTVVFTNGCFDLLHVGHIRFLQEAKAQGDMLVVGINSDASIRQIKGPERPFMPQEERAEVLSALECVDYITIFDELTPEKIIAVLEPDVHCKGGDYASDKPMPEIETVNSYGGQVRILSYTPARSTTELIRNILRRFECKE